MITIIRNHRVKIGLVLSAIGGYMIKAEIDTATIQELFSQLIGG